MSFAHVEYLVFLFVALLGYVSVSRPWRAPLLLLASTVFYAYWSPIHSALLLFSILIDYGVGLGLGETNDPKKRRRLLLISIFGNLALLAAFKYAGLFEDLASTISRLRGGGPVHWKEIALPLGISFYTFQTMSYSLDVYAKRISPCRSFSRFALFVSFFPQLIAGPIERAGHLLPQLEHLEAPKLRDLSRGTLLILWGLAKKIVVADHLREFASPAFRNPENYDPGRLWLSATTMLVVLYADFSGYTDIARGSARLFGVDLVRNFDRTFLATTVARFAARWHMSLSHWVLDYVFSPLSRGLQKRPRHWLIWRNNLIALGVFGLWHGASWKFLVWGLYMGFFISVAHSIRLLRYGGGRRLVRTGPPGPVTQFLGWLGTMIVCILVIVGFFADDLGAAGLYFRGMVTGAGSLKSWIGADVAFGWGVIAVLFAIHASLATLGFEELWRRVGFVGRTLVFLGLALFVLRYRAPLPESFIYFQF